MKKGRKLIIYRKFQLKTALIVSLIVLVFTGSASLVLTYVSYKNNAHLKQIMNEQKEYDTTQLALYNSLIYLANNKGKTIKISADKVEQDMITNSNRIVKTIAEINRIRDLNSFLIISAVIFSLIQLIAVFYLILKQTSGVSGQMKLLNSYLDQFIEGKNPEIRKLRNSDEFHDLFGKLSQLSKKQK